ncbi:TetR family transcriptional regulator [Pseudonocardia sp. WMMC193]|uniref:TetR family transcriptional regulator n=1 Tax=Pseudonocardia sp. WMMC193 TaxID=2911965 RepID=UPI001F0006F4|nr:TetR family transcriptional regulator [Pseudonocardia sp. WMMC193]MCF7549515.1 TetR family transcriptional regulator [Pseudonocardia sp. WMMC193]
MPRPAKPLIRHDAVIETSLRIIDTEGLDAFSLPRLARELNVRAPSLYHHFADKAEILRGIARLIVLETRLPDPETTPTWIDWFVALSLNFRAAVLRHRNAAPVLLQFMPRDVLIQTYDNSARILRDLGIPPAQQVLILDGMDKLTLGASITEAARDPEDANAVFAHVDPEREPTLAEAVRESGLTSDQVFAESIRAFLRGAAPQVSATTPPPALVPAATVGEIEVI